MEETINMTWLTNIIMECADYQSPVLGRMKCSFCTTALPPSDDLFLKLQKKNFTEKKNYNLNSKKIISFSISVASHLIIIFCLVFTYNGG